MKRIMYTEPLFLKAVAGLKTQTRRIIPLSSPINWAPGEWEFRSGHFYRKDSHKDAIKKVVPRFKKWDVVALQEPYKITGVDSLGNNIYDVKITYKFGGELTEWKVGVDNTGRKPIRISSKWQSKMFMPAAYARYFIKIKRVRVERIADISRDDAFAEGIDRHDRCIPVLDEFAVLWDSINGRLKRYTAPGHKNTWVCFPFAPVAEFHDPKRKLHWCVNPWVFAYDYVLCDRGGNSVEHAKLESIEL